MASSQVGFAASCILRDLNQRDGNNHRAFLKKKSKEFVNKRVGNFVDENSHENISNIGAKSRNESKTKKVGNMLDGTEKFDAALSFEPKQVEAEHLGSPKASSLVQIWEERLRRGNSGCSSLENVEDAPRESFSGESDSMSELSFRSRNSDVAENERVRVADIVKKLYNVDGENEGFGTFDQVVCSPRIRGRQAFNELLMQMVRDRHRELEALVDRHAVSKFKHRKRILASVKLRILQRQIAAEGRERTKKLNSPDVKRTSLGSNIMHLRAKFSMGFGRCMTFPGKELESRKPKKEILRSNQHKIEPSSSSQLIEDKCHPEDNSVEQQRIFPVEHSVSQFAEDGQKEVNQSLDAMQATGKKASKFDSQDSRKSPDFPQPESNVSAILCSQPNENIHYQEVRTSGHVNISPLQHHSLSNAEENVHKEANLNSKIRKGPEACNIVSQDPRENIAAFPWKAQSWSFGNIYPGGTADEIMFLDHWDGDEVLEEEYTDEQLMETNYDWVYDIARPRSYWEDCRQSRYQEVLSRESNSEIRQLLERGTVSSFLSSDLRNRIEGLMASRIGRPHSAAVHEEEHGEEGFEQFKLSSNRDTHSLTNLDGARDNEEEVGLEVDSEGSPAMEHHCVDNEEEAETVNSRGRQKRGDMEEVISAEESSNTTMSSHKEVTETDYLDQDHLARDYSDHSASSSSQIPAQSQLESSGFDQITSTTSNPLLQETNHSNSMCHSSIDAEVINDLRGKMEQIQKEMSELRKSVKFCMDFQFEMQQLYMQGVHSVARDGKNSRNKRPRKDCCLICYKNQVNSLLYRCRHMCTCLECAHELQCSSGKCPICQAPIDDVVRAYTDSECC